MKLSRGIARFNRLINNPIQGTYSWLVPPWAAVLHRGRRSGRRYRTPVLAFGIERALIIALLYGEESDWVQNLREGGGYVVRGGHTYPVAGMRLADTATSGELAQLSPRARAYCRVADKQAVLELGEALPGFGTGRQHG